MTKKMRYGLLLAGFLFFIISSPILVFYIQGKSPLFSEKRALDTGIISLDTRPRSASVILDGKLLEDQTPTAIRFLEAGNYDLLVKKDGFKPWNKKLSVMAGKVTHANPEPESLVLLKDELKFKLADETIDNFEVKNNQVFALNYTDKILYHLGQEGEQINSYKLRTKPDYFLTDPDSNLLVFYTSENLEVLELDKKESTIFAVVPRNWSHIQLKNRHLYYIENGVLFSLNLQSLAEPKQLAEDVQTYQIYGNSIYYLTQSESKSTLWHGNLTDASITLEQDLTTDLPLLNNPTLLIDSSKAVFALDNSVLYRINARLESIASGVSSANAFGGALIYFLPGELWWYESTANRAHIISRRSDAFLNAYLKPELQYALFATNLELVALEINAEGGQNKYELASGAVSKFMLLDKTVIYLHEQSLYALPLFP